MACLQREYKPAVEWIARFTAKSGRCFGILCAAFWEQYFNRVLASSYQIGPRGFNQRANWAWSSKGNKGQIGVK